MHLSEAMLLRWFKTVLWLPLAIFVSISSSASDEVCQSLLLPNSASWPATTRSAAIDAKILATGQKLLATAVDYSNQQKPAESPEELKKQLRTLLGQPEINKLYSEANLLLDKMAVTGPKVGLFGIKNLEEFLPGFFRSANPTAEQIKALYDNNLIDQVFAINNELAIVASADPMSTLPLSPARLRTIKRNLSQLGYSKIWIKNSIATYIDNFAYAQAIKNKTIPYLNYHPLDYPATTIDEFLDLAQCIYNLRAQGERILFHCSFGKHRTGILTILLKVLDSKKIPNQSELEDLFTEYIFYNWNESPVTRTQHFIILPLVFKSRPFQEMLSATQNN